MLTFTEQAQERVRSFIQQDGGGGGVALRVGVAPGSPLAPRYELTLVDDWEKTAEDVVLDGGGFNVFVDRDSAEKLEGARVDWVEGMEGGGFKVENPNFKPLGSEPLTGPLAERISQVIDTQINPSIASHGGRVALVDVRDSIAYVELSGGCQGCGMAAVTLKQGIERMILQQIPEITEIVDATDHASGTNPYFDQEK